MCEFYVWKSRKILGYVGGSTYPKQKIYWNLFSKMILFVNCITHSIFYIKNNKNPRRKPENGKDLKSKLNSFWNVDWVLKSSIKIV